MIKKYTITGKKVTFTLQCNEVELNNTHIVVMTFSLKKFF